MKREWKWDLQSSNILEIVDTVELKLHDLKS
jgi:hypothetical protein